MSLIVPDEGELILLSYMVNKTAPSNPVLRLFSNNLVPDDSTAIGGVTEVTAAGYAPITLTGASWTVATVGGVTTAAFAQQTFTFSAAATVYGYYITDGTPKVLWIERFSGAPFTLPSGGGTIAITPRITLD